MSVYTLPASLVKQVEQLSALLAPLVERTEQCSTRTTGRVKGNENLWVYKSYRRHPFDRRVPLIK